jgi:membrane-associated phospholipid phosphatase
MSVLIIFDSLGLIVHRINPQDIDYLLIRLDYIIFGTYPTVVMEKITTPLLTDILQVAYSTYYFIPIVLGIALKFQRKKEEFEKTLFLILFCFYLSYIGYIMFPALGPRYAMQHLHENELGGFLVSQPIQNLLNLLEGVKRDAFPSGHTGVALTALFLSYIYTRRFFLVLLIPVILLIIATVYCRYHYVVDIIGGILLTVVTIVIGEVYYKFWTDKVNGNTIR